MDTHQITDETVDTLVALERQGWDALCDGSAAAFYDRIMTADAVMILANGAVMTRQDVVAALAESPAWDGYELSDARAVPAGDRTTCLVYRATARRQKDAEPFTGAMTSVYVNEADGWRLALYQQTPVPPRT